MEWLAAATLGSSLLGGLFGDSAADAQADAADDATELAQQQFDYQVETADPYLQAGYDALDELLGLFGLSETDASGETIPDIAYVEGETTTSSQPVDTSYAAYYQAGDADEYGDYVSWSRAQADNVTTTETVGDGYWTVGDQQFATETEAQTYRDSLSVDATTEGTEGTGDEAETDWFEVLFGDYLTDDTTETVDTTETTETTETAETPIDYNAIYEGFEQYQDSDHYSALYESGQDSVNQYLGQTGQIYSGAALEAATEYGQNFASSQWDNYFDQSLALSDEARAQGSYDLSELLTLYNTAMSDEAYDDGTAQQEVNNLLALMGYGSSAADDVYAASSAYTDAATDSLYAGADADSYSATNWANSINAGLDNYLTYDLLSA